MSPGVLVLASPSDIVDGVNAAIFHGLPESDASSPRIARLGLHRRGARRMFACVVLVLRRYLADHGVSGGARDSARARATHRRPAAIQLDHVSRWYGNVVAVNDMSFALGSGVTGLLGPNGAGKIHAAPPARGAAGAVGRHGPHRRSPGIRRSVDIRDGRARPGAGSRPRLRDRSRVRPAQRRAAGHRHAAAATDRAIGTVEMVDAADRQIRTYSKGMRQRASSPRRSSTSRGSCCSTSRSTAWIPASGCT